MTWSEFEGVAALAKGWKRGLTEIPSNLNGSVYMLFEKSSRVQTPTIDARRKLVVALTYFSFCLASHSIR